MYGTGNTIGCLSVSVSLLNKGLDVGVSRIGNGLEATASRVGKGLVVQASLVCSVEEVVDTHIQFLVKEGAFILVDGKQFKVLRYELSE